jgi:CubicO group peptidase (beta-lactamase class C family)
MQEFGYMRYRLVRSTLLCLACTFPWVSQAAYAETFDYFESNRQLIRNGVQAVLQCNGLYTSGRTLEQVFSQELAYLTDERFGGRVGTAQGGAYQVDPLLRRVTVGGGHYGTPVSAVFREGVGCVVMGPDQSLEDIASLPESLLPYSDIAPSDVDWPDGDRIVEAVVAPELDPERLQAASDWAFNRATPEQDTLSLIVVHKGQIVHERYAAGITRETRTRTWSTAKSIAVTLVGILVDEGRLKLDEPLGFPWQPELLQPAQDPRNTITLRHVLQMSSGLYPVDSFNKEYATGSGLAYWAGASSVAGMLDRGLVRQPGTYWDYENYDTLLAVYAMKQALGSSAAYAEYPRKALLDRIGMRNTLVSTDRFGDFIFSSQVYSNARDLARFGLLYAQDGMWNGERLLSVKWIDFVRTPAPATRERGNFYGAQWWLVPDDRHDVPRDAYATAGNRGQYVVVVPSHDLVIVRRGLDYGKQGFDRWDLTREIITAFAAP